MIVQGGVFTRTVTEQAPRRFFLSYPISVNLVMGLARHSNGWAAHGTQADGHGSGEQTLVNVLVMGATGTAAFMEHSAESKDGGGHVCAS
jgi:hypothetical protein